MVLPLLFSFGLPALAGTGALGATLAGMSAPVLSGLGAGLGSFLQSGDIGKGVQTGLTAVLGGKLLGGLGGGMLGGQQTATNALSTSSPMSAVLAAPAKESILQPVLGDTLTKTMAAPGMMESALIGSSVASALDYKAPKKKETEVPDPRPKIRVVKKKPDNFQGEFDYFDYYDPDDYVQYARGGGLMSIGMLHNNPMAGLQIGYAEGGEVEGMNEKDVILESILAIKGMKSEAEAQMILGKFLSEYGEAALRDLVDSVQSGEYDETVARFAEGEKGMVRGPGDGSGEDDKVPATLDNQQDVLLTEGEFVIRKPTTDALTKEYGGGFLDRINEAEGDAPEVLRKMVG